MCEDKNGSSWTLFGGWLRAQGPTYCLALAERTNGMAGRQVGEGTRERSGVRLWRWADQPMQGSVSNCQLGEYFHGLHAEAIRRSAWRVSLSWDANRWWITDRDTWCPSA
jgi:hypothetical protein